MVMYMNKEVKKIGIICEYNPFHNGHIYHIEKIKEMFPESIIILVMSGCFTERGEISILNKWDKTEIALNHKVDLVVELPHFYATNSADIFAEGSIRILSYLNCDYLVFGSENNDIDLFNRLVDTQLYNTEYDKLVHLYMDNGFNYPTSMSCALKDLTEETINTPNDLLGLSYIKQIRIQESKIIPLTIKRTNNYHDKIMNGNIASATSIRESLKRNEDISLYVPDDTNNHIIKDYEDNYFKLLKYKIISEINELDKYLDVSEGLDKRIKKFILKCNSKEELIDNIKTKRYTYNRLNRMLLHIVTNIKKSDVIWLKQINYIKVLGFTSKGKEHLKEVRKEGLIPIITNYSELDDSILDFELQITFIYNYITNQENLNQKELKSIPIMK